MKKYFSILALVFLGMAVQGCKPAEKHLLLITTNDIHAHIADFPRLATAVRQARDTADVLLLDAGDRWTGSAYVDRADGRLPVIRLMNRLGYDAATLGNHEFDPGQAVLQRSIDSARFPVLCANLHCGATAAMRPTPPSAILERSGIRIGIVGAVTNYGPNGHPDGHDEVFEGLTFTDGVETLLNAQDLVDNCDVRIALSHLGHPKDFEVATAAPRYHAIVGGHSHTEVDTLINGVQVTQTGKNLRNVGVVDITLSGRTVKSVDYRNYPIAGFEPDPEFTDLVKEIYANPALHVPVGKLARTADKTGLANLFTESIRRATGADAAFYHIGGVRSDMLPEGDVPLCAIYDLDPFGSHVSTFEATPEELRRFLLTIFNEEKTGGIPHIIDLYSTTPYTVVTDGQTATNVLFPDLQEGRRYRIAISDYAFKNYKGANDFRGRTTDIAVTDALLSTVRNGGKPFTPDNMMRQQILQPAK